MESKTYMSDRCPHCGAMILPRDKFCPQCGTPLEAEGKSIDYAEDDGWQPGMIPVTIGQLSAYCEYNEMPLETMRFFVGEDYRQPRAFGIYQEGDQFIVYKNKADGSRAVRYHGPDEAYAVGELYDKLLDECHKRDIWPDGKPEDAIRDEKRAKRQFFLMAAGMLAVFIVVSFFAFRDQERRHAHDGYYRFDDPGLYYCYGDDWYYNDAYYDWVLWDSMSYDEGDYLGDDYDASWGYSNFEESETWERIQEENRTSSDDYSSWDSNDTDWDSDW